MPPEESEAKAKPDPSRKFERFAFVNNAEAIYFPPEYARRPEIQSLKRVFNKIAEAKDFSDEEKIYAQKFLMNMYLIERNPQNHLNISKNEFLKFFPKDQELINDLDAIAKGGIKEEEIPELASAIKGDDGIWSILKSGDEDLEIYHPIGDLAAKMINNEPDVINKSYIKGVYKASEPIDIIKCYHVSFNTDFRLPNLPKKDKAKSLAATYEEIGKHTEEINKGAKKDPLTFKDVAIIALSALTGLNFKEGKLGNFLDKFLGLSSGKTQGSKGTLNLEGELKALQGQPVSPPPATSTTVKASDGTSSPPGPAAAPNSGPKVIPVNETSEITTPDTIDVEDYARSGESFPIPSLGGCFAYTKNGCGIIKINKLEDPSYKYIPPINEGDVLIFEYNKESIIFDEKEEPDFHKTIREYIEAIDTSIRNKTKRKNIITASLYTKGNRDKHFYFETEVFKTRSKPEGELELQYKPNGINTPHTINVRRHAEIGKSFPIYSLGGMFAYTKNGNGVIKTGNLFRHPSNKTIPKIDKHDVLIFKYHNVEMTFKEEGDFYEQIKKKY